MLVIKELRKTYDQFSVQISELKLENDKIYSFIGPNGAGKTTLISCIAGISPVDEGSIELNGAATRNREIKKHIGYFPDDKAALPQISIIAIMQEINKLKYHSKYSEQIEYLLRRYSLWEDRKKLVKQCSLGMIKKLEICMSLLGNPDLIILDEPTNGIDTSAFIKLKDDILIQKERGATVIITSHILDFLQDISDENFFIKNGEVVHFEEDNTRLESVYKSLYLDEEND